MLLWNQALTSKKCRNDNVQIVHKTNMYLYVLPSRQRLYKLNDEVYVCTYHREIKKEEIRKVCYVYTFTILFVSKEKAFDIDL